MPLFRKRRKAKTEPETKAETQAAQSVSLASGRLAPIFQRMYLWILSVNLNFNVYQVESGTASFAGQPMALRGQYDRLLDAISDAIMPEYREKLNATLTSSALREAFRSGRTNVRTPVCYMDQEEELHCVELRVERIPDDKNQNDTALIYARMLRDEDDLGEIYKKPVPIAHTPDGGIDWSAVRFARLVGSGALHYEYDVQADCFYLHVGSGEQEKTTVWSRFLSSLDSRSDYIIAHSSVKTLHGLMKAGLAGNAGNAQIAFRTDGKRSAALRHYRMTCYPLEESGAPTWLYGSLADIEDEYKKQMGLQEVAIEIGTVVDQVFSGLYVIDTDKNTICSLVKTEGGYRTSEYIQKYSEFLRQRMNSGMVAPESEESVQRLMQKGFLDSRAAKKSFEIDLRLKLPGSLEYAWYVETFTPIPGKPHRYMLSRRDITAIYEAKQREFEYSESMRMVEYNQCMLDNMAGLVEFRNLETGAHIYHVRTLTRILLNDLARRSPQYGLEPRLIDLYCHASIMHDIGKIVTPDSILNKPGRLSDKEYALMKQHTLEGGRIIRGLQMVGQDELKDCCYDVAMHHHERWDGNGYPEGLVKDENSIYVQAIGLADVFDALVSKRCYKPANTVEKATQMILNGECGAFNPRLMESFMHCLPAMQQEYQSELDASQEQMEVNYGK